MQFTDRRLPSSSALALALAFACAAHAEPQTVEIYAAGSLRTVVTELAQQVAPAFGVEVKPTFGGSGSLREKIEHGDKPDLLMSADLGSPRKLAEAGRTVVPAVAFARNRICIVSRTAAHVTPSNLIDRMLKPEVRLKTSQPVADPGGDYAWAILDKIDTLRPGKGQILKDKAQRSMDLKAAPIKPDQSPAAALFASNLIDLSITYCSASAALVKELPELTSFEVPAVLDPHPVYGLAVLSNKPEAMRVALYLLSDKGQAILSEAGLLPVLDAGASHP